jgi:hypothetical protein
MIERLEVTPGPGTVVRYGFLTAWVSASASPNLVSFLTESARNLASSPVSGDQLAEHLVRVLQRRDPEPHVPFAAIGPSQDGWVALLHGPVQVWDGVRWTAPDAHPGWLRSALSPSPALSVSVSGASVAPISPDSMLDLEAGVVPGGGFILVPSVPAAARPLPVAVAAPDEPDEPHEPDETEPHETAEPEEALTAVLEITSDPPVPTEALAPPEPPPEPAREPGPPGVVHLRSRHVRARVVAYPPLPPAGDPPRPTAGAPVVAGAPCPRGHLNRPGMRNCARCTLPLGADGAYQASGTRPALGCLITDEGAVYRLDSGYLVGADPARDPTVRGRLARPLVLAGDDVAPSHAEIRLHDWDVVLTDRASNGGTHVLEMGAAGWERIPPYEPRVLQPGTHLAFGQRVATFVTPWTPDGAGIGQDTRSRY